MAKNVSSSKVEKAPTARGVLWELEHLLCPGRRLLFESLGAVLKDEGLNLTPALFARHLVPSPGSEQLQALLSGLGLKKTAAERGAARAEEGFLRAVQQQAAPEPQAAALLASLLKAGARLGAVTFLPEEVARELLERFGLQENVALLTQDQNARGGLTANSWLQLAKSLRLLPQRCVALVSSATACKTALVSGMRCVALPDPWTGHHDFGGCDLIVEHAGELRAADLLALLHPCAFR